MVPGDTFNSSANLFNVNVVANRFLDTSNKSYFDETDEADEADNVDETDETDEADEADETDETDI